MITILIIMLVLVIMNIHLYFRICNIDDRIDRHNDMIEQQIVELEIFRISHNDLCILVNVNKLSISCLENNKEDKDYHFEKRFSSYIKSILGFNTNREG